MSKVERLFARLERLESEYRGHLIVAGRAELDGTFSRVASRAFRPGLLAGKFWRDVESARVEWLEKEIAGLRQKLVLPLAGSPVSSLRRLQAALAGTAEGESKRLIKEFVDELGGAPQAT